MLLHTARPARVEDAHLRARRRRRRQLLIYAMTLAADWDVAMVLPIPVPPSPGDDAVRFVDMSSCPKFFDEIDALFPHEMELAFGGAAYRRAAVPAPQPLVVHEVGDFEASFVPARRDFERLDERFRLSGDVWDALPAYGDWGFCVFKLRAVAQVPSPIPATEEPRGLVDRVRGLFRAASASSPPEPPRRAFHPMAFEFPRRDRSRLFFPTVHVHDGKVHAHAAFDHQLYCQLAGDGGEPLADARWRLSRGRVKDTIRSGNALEWIEAESYARKLELVGRHPNRDVYVEAAADGG